MGNNRMQTHATLYYDIRIYEENINKKGQSEVITTSLPHFDQISEWLPKEWDKCKVTDTFYGILEGKVESAVMTVRQNRRKETKATVKLVFVPGFRMTKERKVELLKQMDGQMVDGFGENLDSSNIPGVPDNFRILI